MLLGWGGWFSARRIRVPAPAILGPMLVVGAATALGYTHPEFPGWVKTGLQIVVGAYLGYNVDRTAVVCIRSMLKPVALATVWMITAAIFIGWLLAQLTRIDLTTALLATSPGGIAEMSAMAISSQANVALVATLQSFRIVSTLLAIPFLAREAAGSAGSPKVRSASPNRTSAAIGSTFWTRNAWVAWFIVGFAGSALFGLLRVPAAGVIGSMVAVAAVRIAGLDAERPPASLRTLAQVGLGVLIGASFDSRTVMILREEIVLVLAVTAATVSSGLGLAGVIQRMLKTDRQTALLASAPGGMSQMGIIADELGSEVFVVNMFQLARLIAAVLVLPLIVRLIAQSY